MKRNKKVYVYTLYLITGAEVSLIADNMDKSNNDVYYWLNKECVGKFLNDKIIGYTKKIYAYEISSDEDNKT